MLRNVCSERFFWVMKLHIILPIYLTDRWIFEKTLAFSKIYNINRLKKSTLETLQLYPTFEKQIYFFLTRADGHSILMNILSIPDRMHLRSSDFHRLLFGSAEFSDSLGSFPVIGIIFQIAPDQFNHKHKSADNISTKKNVENSIDVIQAQQIPLGFHEQIISYHLSRFYLLK